MIALWVGSTEAVPFIGMEWIFDIMYLAHMRKFQLLLWQRSPQLYGACFTSRLLLSDLNERS